MKWVDLVEFDAVSKKADVAVRATLDGGQVRLEGDSKVVQQLKEKGVFSPKLQKMVKPADGEPFLEALGQEFNNAYFFATRVQEGEEPEPPESFRVPSMDDVPEDPSDKPPAAK